MKIAIYTAILGDYETPRSPLFKDEGIDYILFTDRAYKSFDWDVRYISHSGFTMRKSARAVKILSHEYLSDYDLTIWVDANFCQKKSLMPLIEKMQNDIMLLQHPKKKCIYKEGEACIDFKLDYQEVIEQQMHYYKTLEYPENNGLVATGLLIRKNTEEINQLNSDWWYEVLSKSGRDQLSFNFVAWQNNIKFDTVPFNTLYEYFDAFHHKQKRKYFE